MAFLLQTSSGMKKIILSVSSLFILSPSAYGDSPPCVGKAHAPLGTICKTTSGFLFQRDQSPATGELGWRDLAANKVWYDQVSTKTGRISAKNFCDSKPGQKLPSKTDIRVADYHGFQEVFPNIKSRWIWSELTTVSNHNGSFRYIGENKQMYFNRDWDSAGALSAAADDISDQGFETAYCVNSGEATISQSLPPCLGTQLSKATEACVTSADVVFRRYQDPKTGKQGWLDTAANKVWFDFIYQKFLDLKTQRISFELLNTGKDEKALATFCKEQGQTLPSVEDFLVAEAHEFREALNDVGDFQFLSSAPVEKENVEVFGTDEFNLGRSYYRYLSHYDPRIYGKQPGILAARCVGANPALP
jgi:hypothetical protein